GVGRRLDDGIAGALVAGDQVEAVHPGRVADGVAGGPGLDQHAVAAVAQSAGAVNVRADEIPLDQVGVGAPAADPDTVGCVTGDEVAEPGGDAADGVVAGTAHDEDAVAAVTQGLRTGLGRADVVVLDDVGGCVGNADPHVPVAGDHVEAPGGRPADGVAGGSRLDPHAGGAVAQGTGAGRVGADAVAFHQVAGGPGSREAHPVVGV